ncbi:histone-lysine N-methyltransferase substrate of the Dot/Icm secretion system [Legionella qingyii]|uniref:Histone-lysine N-methyltransferase substrate of the Dot/Icm secretion system n=1 Tax=Legionella qingyii TaxID=2184757 RepID=A0A317U470_9GAMM|nr:Dot/Icm T4SS effector AnkI/LegAS4 [Legionella qingyii]PWY56189.1 histone-lysine N-methyltransferase substrate of the Dot/Icm secretion system [Legionella qingyii]RUR22216.1 SET domain-containing protein-lysine N-methyltransferase [Legionella qingyii]RUR25792.1 SET domain-containing protein-lysine N-methyltransferase [Legionella qingyii]
MPKKLKTTILRKQKQRAAAAFQVKFKLTQVHVNSFFAKNSKLDESNLRKLKKLIKSLGIKNMEAENYLSSSVDQPELVKVMPVNLLKEFGGQGLYAYVDIPAGTCLGEYTGELYPTTTLFKTYVNQTSGADWSYAMTLGHRVIDGKDKGNFTRYINFSDTQANVEFREDVVNGIKCVKVIATKDIPKGKQLLVDYNCYDERASKEYFFLSPEDNWQSAQEVLDSNSRVYRLFVMQKALTLLNLKENDSLYVTKIGEVILSGKQLSLDQKKIIQDDINLPFLKTNLRGKVLDFNHADSFTALMLASYLGQVENVKWLVTNHANIDQQQNHSGNCALFFALAGYAASETKNQKRAYLDVLCILIDSQANILVHDREDRTFLHKAIDVLALSDFKLLMGHIAEKKQFNPEEILSYIDKNNQDIFIYCLVNKDFNKASVLLRLCSDFFRSEYFNYGSKYEEKIGKGMLINLINEFEQDEKSALLKLLSNPRLKLDQDFISSLDLSEEEDLSFSN